MQVFRLSKAKFAESLSGIGAAQVGGRWNSVGVELIYAASNRALAMAEVAVHFTLATLPPDYVMTVIHIPDSVEMALVDSADLPENWREFPHPLSTKAIGDKFVAQGDRCFLQVPSAVVRGDYNVLINPNHQIGRAHL